MQFQNSISTSIYREQKSIISIFDEAIAGIDKAKTNTERELQNFKEVFESYLQNAFGNPGEIGRREIRR